MPLKKATQRLCARRSYTSPVSNLFKRFINKKLLTVSLTFLSVFACIVTSSKVRTLIINSKAKVAAAILSTYDNALRSKSRRYDNLIRFSMFEPEATRTPSSIKN